MQKIDHPPGHDNHGVHVCHKCGWSFPNPHPSAKHRRAHKKVCGKIEGFKMENKTHLISSDDDSDEDHGSSVLKGQQLVKDEKGSGTNEAEVEGASRSAEEVFSDAVADFADTGSSLVVESVDSADVNLEGKIDDKAGHDTLEASSGNTGCASLGAAVVSGGVLQPDTDSERKSDDQRVDTSLEASTADAGSDPMSKAIARTGVLQWYIDSQRKSDDQVGNLATGSPSDTPDMEVKGTSNEDKSSCIPASKFSQIDSELQKTDEFPKSDVPSLLTMDGTIKMPGATPDNIQKENADLPLEHKPQNEIFASTHLGSVDVEAHKHLEALVDAAQTPQRSPHDDAVQPLEGSPHIDDIQAPERGQHVDSIQERDVVDPNEVAESSSVLRDEDESLRLKDVTVERISEMKPEVDSGETDPIILHVQEQQTNSLGQQTPQNELSSHAYAGITQVEAGEEANLENPSDTAENSYIHVHGHGDENLNILSDSKMLCQQEELTDSLGQQKPQNELSSNAYSGTPQDKTGEFTDHVMKARKQMVEASVDTMVGCNSHPTVDEEEKPDIPIASLAATTTSEMNSEASKDLGPVEMEGVLTSFVADVGGAEEVHPQEEAHLGLVSVKSEDLGNMFPSTVQVAEGSTGNGVYGILTVDQSGSDGISGEKETQCVGPQSSESVDESPLLDETGANSVNGKPAVSKAVPPDNAVMTSGIGPTVGDSEEKAAESSSREQESQSGLSHEIQPKAIIVDISGTSNMESTVAAAEVLPETTTESSGYDVVDKEARHIGTDLDGEYSQEGSRDEESRSDSRTQLESASDVAAKKQQFPADLGTDKVERDLKPTESTLSGEVLGHEGTNISTSRLESTMEHNSDQSLQQIASGSCSDPYVTQLGGQVAGNEIHSRFPETHLEEPISSENFEPGSCQSTAQNPTYEKDVTPTVDKDSAQDVLTVQNIKAKDLVEGEAHDSHLHSLQEESFDILKQHSNASVLTTEMSADSNSQTDSLEGNWGSVSDGTIRFTRDASDPPVTLAPETQSQVQASNVKGKTGREQQIDNTDVFEAPSFMTLVEPGRSDSRHPASTEIQSLQNPQRPNLPSSQAAWFPSLKNVVNESEGRRKNEEIIAKVANWSAGKPHAPLKSLLVEANLERKQKSPTKDPKIIHTHKVQTSKDDTPPAKPASELSIVSDNKGTILKEWNSPARLPDSTPGKRKVKGRAHWVPFACCSSVN